MAEGLEISIDREACQGAAECLFRAPDTFELDAENRAIVTDPAGDTEEDIVMAARTCPNFAIRVERDGEELA